MEHLLNAANAKLLLVLYVGMYLDGWVTMYVPKLGGMVQVPGRRSTPWLAELACLFLCRKLWRWMQMHRFTTRGGKHAVDSAWK